ncbi:MAG: zf-HC2 domain-containing protein [Chloroflexi bacterium]|nr:zf-HC2 domain-containing protein [Chloroflexota bacterium]
MNLLQNISCEEARSQLEDYIAGSILPNDRRSVGTHLRSCSACREIFEAHWQMDKLLLLLPRTFPREELINEILVNVDKADRRQRWIAVAGSTVWGVLILWVLYSTWLGLQEGPLSEVINMVMNDPALIWRFPLEVLGAILENLPIFEFASIVILVSVGVWLIRRFLPENMGPGPRSMREAT